MAEDGDFAGSRREQPFQDFDGGGLPCPIGTEESEALARFDAQADPADGFDFSVVGLVTGGALDRCFSWRPHQGILNQLYGSESNRLGNRNGAAPSAIRHQSCFSMCAMS